MTIWVIRAGEGGKYVNDFLERNIISIGWEKLGDLSRFASRDSMLKAIQQEWPGRKPGWWTTSASQLYRFVHEMREGDRVLTYDPKRRIYHAGIIAGGYRHLPDNPDHLKNVHPVRWQAELARDDLSVRAKNSLGAILTLFMIPDDVSREIEALLKGEGPSIQTEQSLEQDEAELAHEFVEAKALELIKDKLSQLDWEQMQELVAGLLRAMGYKTVVSARGPDRGKDIVASPDGLGFENPRIVVEVKHRSGAIGANEVRSFIGGRHQDDKGLFVSTGGFTKDAYYEAERAKIPLTLMTLDELVQSLLDEYEKLDLDTQQLIPLKRIYWPL